LELKNSALAKLSLPVALFSVSYPFNKIRGRAHGSRQETHLGMDGL